MTSSTNGSLRSIASPSGDDIQLQRLGGDAQARNTAENNSLRREIDLDGREQAYVPARPDLPRESVNLSDEGRPDVFDSDPDLHSQYSAQGAGPSLGPSDLDFWGTTLLAVQHASSSWGYRSAEFAYPLYMVVLFTNTLLPASVYGFVTTAAAILFSNSIGRTIDRYSHTKLRTLRAFVVVQKLLVCASYALFLILFFDDRLRSAAQNGGNGADNDGRNSSDVWSVFAAITLLGCGVILSNVGISVSVEREWVQIISRDSPARLTRLNAIMRRIDLLSKLLSPFFVSLLTTAISYKYSVVILMGTCALSAIFELVFVGIVYQRFPALAENEEKVTARRLELQRQEAESQASGRRTSPRERSASEHSKQMLQRVAKRIASCIQGGFVSQYQDWALFVRMPVFVTSVCISLLYMSVLSFDSTFIAYLKSETQYTDAFIAGMRGVGVVAGLLGTVWMPWMDKKIGLVRTGSYSLFSELIPLIPAVVALFETGAPTPAPTPDAARRFRPEWNTALLFTGLSLSRIGLWAFDLAQLAQIQTALSPAHLPPQQAERKNALMALQFSLQNVFDLGHYGLTLGWNRPQQFKYAAAVSLGAVASATFLYLVGYARRVRGHIIHLDWFGLESLLRRKDQ